MGASIQVEQSVSLDEMSRVALSMAIFVSFCFFERTGQQMYVWLN